MSLAHPQNPPPPPIPQSPVWENDYDTSTCRLCHKTFNLWCRRHHCRRCGKVVCADCSSQFIYYTPLVAPPPTASSFSTSSPFSSLASPQTMMSKNRTCDKCADTMLKQSRTREITSQLPSSSSTSSLRRDNISDANLCPVCGINLLKEFITLRSPHNHDVIPQDEFEKYKEDHINDCLNKFDLTAQQANNKKMLVYILAPIPKPQYEIIPRMVDSVLPEMMTSNTTEKEEYEECMICLEELKPGDKVGRLECLCVFHYKCIKDWFNKKGYGECPVHFLHK
ncbi:hypothetical protein LELG_05357 [Lodderomyces elongisporus NRRL YB-4239]|uniref:RING-type E3 ubiquitin transferase n=1 Tax=Lodderomyces elongisporus (strain ATCC 11503 / CBS 2605 / JCM 1781 / NBRC 1676 / NRRL YB-4239) TaxID=379508 RepID=A5E6W8_LODEL|nr:hypothetical protein LELG_05357 [Lodderomyces elongisporus NRRL YB-4239]